MGELFQSSLPYQGLVLVLAFMLCIAPHLGSRGRAVLAGMLALPVLGLLIDVLAFDHGFDNTLEVPNVFGRGTEGEPHVWTVAVVSAPAWQWHVVLMFVLGLPALWLWLRRRRPPGSPHPFVMAVLLFWFFLASRLLLEAYATHRPIAWGFGASVAQLVALPFFAFWCSKRGIGFGKFVGLLAVLALAQRLPLIVFAWFATTMHLGTHLDVHVITDANIPMVGDQTFTDDAGRWLWLHLFPQTTSWVIMTVVAGIILGLLPFRIGKRRSAPATS